MFNHGLGPDSPWRSVPFKVCTPRCVPAALGADYCAVLVQTGDAEDIVVGGLRAGIFLTKEQLQLMWQAFKFELPPKGHGSGKNGSLVKQDFARGLLRYFFPGFDESSEQWLFMLRGILGSFPKPSCSDDVLTAVAALDPIAQEDFKEIKKAAKNQRHYQDGDDKGKKRKAKDDAAEGLPSKSTARDPASVGSPGRRASAGSGIPQERKTYTPGELQGLIPGKGCLAGVYLKRIPGGANGKCYQGFYPPGSGSSGSGRLLSSPNSEPQRPLQVRLELSYRLVKYILSRCFETRFGLVGFLWVVTASGAPVSTIRGHD